MTMIPRVYTRLFGCEELHAVFFQHRPDRGGVSPSVMVMIPEAADKLTAALVQARNLQARLVIVCDTKKQARDAKQAALELLSDHLEVSQCRAQVGAWGSIESAKSGSENGRSRAVSGPFQERNGWACFDPQTVPDRASGTVGPKNGVKALNLLPF